MLCSGRKLLGASAAARARCESSQKAAACACAPCFCQRGRLADIFAYFEAARSRACKNNAQRGMRMLDAAFNDRVSHDLLSVATGWGTRREELDGVPARAPPQERIKGPDEHCGETPLDDWRAAWRPNSAGRLDEGVLVDCQCCVRGNRGQSDRTSSHRCATSCSRALRTRNDAPTPAAAVCQLHCTEPTGSADAPPTSQPCPPSACSTP